MVHLGCATPALAVASVLDHDAERQQFIAQAVRCRPVAGGPSLGSRIDHGGRIGGQWRSSSSGRTPRTSSRSRSAAIARAASAVDRDRAVDPPIELADQVEDGGQAGRDIEVVVERGSERLARGAEHDRQLGSSARVLAIRVSAATAASSRSTAAAAAVSESSV